MSYLYYLCTLLLLPSFERMTSTIWDSKGKRGECLGETKRRHLPKPLGLHQYPPSPFVRMKCSQGFRGGAFKELLNILGHSGKLLIFYVSARRGIFKTLILIPASDNHILWERGCESYPGLSERVPIQSLPDSNAMAVCSSSTSKTHCGWGLLGLPLSPQIPVLLILRTGEVCIESRYCVCQSHGTWGSRWPCEASYRVARLWLSSLEIWAFPDEQGQTSGHTIVLISSFSKIHQVPTVWKKVFFFFFFFLSSQ